MADEFFYKFNPDAPEVGPIDSKTLKQLASSGAIQSESLIRRDTGEWVTASTVKGLFPGSSAASPPEAIPVDPPEAQPVATATPVASSSPPEAIPVAPPATEAGGGMSFPDLTQPKAATDVPAGLDSLVVAPKKPTGKPAKKGNPVAAKKAAPSSKSEAPKLDLPSVATPKVEAPKVDVPKAEPVAAPVAAAAVATKPAPETANPYAADPPAGKTKARRKGSGGLASLFNFDVMIAPTVIKTLFFLISGLLFLVYLAITAISLVSAILTGDVLAIAGAGGIALVGFLVVLIYIIILRVSAEVSLVFFTINDNVRDVRDMMADHQGTIE